MDKSKQSLAMLAASSLLALVAGLSMPDGGSGVRDFFQGFLTGMGAASSLLTIFLFAKTRKHRT
ncbi:hypothetical protein [Paenibacillus tengchongensis]|uniref:hypothetical protein n=1 Tax=Paenibacillus tengchongensis TaxID=2608684 RepID=UPI00124E6D47|nr:hypothetical protein [Paenibacillus tengchongensis]